MKASSLCSSAKSSIDMLHIHGTIFGELLVLLHQQEREEEPWKKGQGSTCQGLPQFLFPGLSGSYQTGKSQLT